MKSKRKAQKNKKAESQQADLPNYIWLGKLFKEK
jgi:hypothetical protein